MCLVFWIVSSFFKFFPSSSSHLCLADRSISLCSPMLKTFETFRANYVVKDLSIFRFFFLCLFLCILYFILHMASERPLPISSVLERKISEVTLILSIIDRVLCFKYCCCWRSKHNNMKMNKYLEYLLGNVDTKHFDRRMSLLFCEQRTTNLHWFKEREKEK